MTKLEQMTDEELRRAIRNRQNTVINRGKRRTEIRRMAEQLGYEAASFNISTTASPIFVADITEAYKAGYSQRIKEDIKEHNGGSN